MTGLSLLRGDAGSAGGGAPLDPGATPAATPSAIVATTVSAVLRAVAAVLAGLFLVSGAALVLWALTPGDGSDSTIAVRGGVVAFAAAHLLPVSFSSVAVTVTPLLLTGVMIAVIATSAGRARMVRGRLLEALHASVFVVFYAVGVDVASAVLAPAGTVQAGLAGPLAVAAVGAVVALAFHATAWRRWWRLVAPSWLLVGLRAGLVTTLALLTVAAAALAIGLAVAFPRVSTVAGLTVHSPGDALGMALLCLAFLPNAAIAAVGYVTGVGFNVGAATFSPLAVHHAELPAIPLLAAAPEHSSSAAAWAVLVGSVAAAAFAGVLILRGTDTRAGRLLACGVAALSAAVLALTLAAAAGGGVAGGPWASAGAPPLTTASLVAGITVVVTGALAVSTGWRALPWRWAGDHDVVVGLDPESEEQDDEAGADKAIPDGAVPDGAEIDGAEIDGAVAEDAIIDGRMTDAGRRAAVPPEPDADDAESPEDYVTLDALTDAARTRDTTPDDPLVASDATGPNDAADCPDAERGSGLADAS